MSPIMIVCIASSVRRKICPTGYSCNAKVTQYVTAISPAAWDRVITVAETFKAVDHDFMPKSTWFRVLAMLLASYFHN